MPNINVNLNFDLCCIYKVDPHRKGVTATDLLIWDTFKIDLDDQNIIIMINIVVFPGLNTVAIYIG